VSINQQNGSLLEDLMPEQCQPGLGQSILTLQLEQLVQVELSLLLKISLLLTNKFTNQL
jgi:hypothetical protein